MSRYAKHAINSTAICLAHTLGQWVCITNRQRRRIALAAVEWIDTHTPNAWQRLDKTNAFVCYCCRSTRTIVKICYKSQGTYVNRVGHGVQLLFTFDSDECITIIGVFHIDAYAPSKPSVMAIGMPSKDGKT